VPRRAIDEWFQTYQARQEPTADDNTRQVVHGVRRAWTSVYSPGSLDALRRYIR
jgi:hypothetical protein